MKNFKFIVLLFIILPIIFCDIHYNHSDRVESSYNIANKLKNAELIHTNIGKTATINLTEAEKIYIKNLKEKAPIKVAMRNNYSVYQIEEDGTINGFHYHLINEFSNYFEIPLEIKVVNYSDFFINTNNNEKYPDLLNIVDIYTDGLIYTDWDSDSFIFVPVLPIKLLVSTKTRHEIISLDGFNNKVVAITPNTIYYKKLEELKQKGNLNFDIIHIEDPIDSLKAVSEYDADLTIQNSSVILKMAGAIYDNLNSSLSVSEIKNLGWVLKKEDEMFANIIEKFILYLHQKGKFNELWQQDYRVSFVEYLRIIGL